MFMVFYEIDCNIYETAGYVSGLGVSLLGFSTFEFAITSYSSVQCSLCILIFIGLQPTGFVGWIDYERLFSTHCFQLVNV